MKQKKQGAGRPPLDLDVHQIEELAGILCTMNEIAAIMKCSVDTLERNFADTIKKAQETGRASLRRQQYKLAMDGNPTMLIWLGKQMLGQTDKVENRNTEEKRIVYESVVDSSGRIKTAKAVPASTGSHIQPEEIQPN